MMPDLTLNQKLDTILDKLSGAAKRVYDYEHTSFAVKDLDTVYTDIVEENPELASKSAIGFTALLNSGETVSKQGNRMFIYGKAPESEGADVEIEEELEDYTYSDAENPNGTEFVIVWYFTNNGALNFGSCPQNMFIANIIKKGDNALINVEVRCFNFMRVLFATDYQISNPIVDTYIIKSYDYGTLKPTIGNYVKRFISLSKVMTSSAGNINLSLLTEASFPELEEINLIENNRNFLSVPSAQNARISFPKLTKIINLRLTNGGLVAGFGSVVIPETLIEFNENLIGYFLKNISQKVTLNCKNLESMPDAWYTGTAPAELEIIDNFGCSINLASVTPASWTKDNFVDLFTNKLRNMTPTDETRTLKIPTAIYNALTTEEIAIATAKGWTITHP